MRRFLLLVPCLLAGCLAGTHYRSEAKLESVLSELDDVQRKLNEPPPPVRQLATAGAQPVAEHQRTGRLSVRTVFAGGHLELFGVPSKSTEQVVLAFRPVGTLGAQCTPFVFRDEKLLSIGEIARRSDHELLLTLLVDELGASARFVGEACGRSFELDEAGRATVASFAARFREKTQIDAKTSGSSNSPVAATFR